jgi:hypothetical protein
MGYCIELKNISLAEYKEVLKNQNLLPGRRILQDNIDGKFEILFACGIKNLDELHKNMNTPQKLSAFSVKSGLSADYLTILKREIGSLIQKPVLIADFPGLPPDIKIKLSENGITKSNDLYELSNGFKDEKVVCNKTGISGSEVNELFCLCDLVRINGVGAVFARILLEAGYKNAGAVAGADAEEMLTRISGINDKKQYTKAKLGKKDMQFCIDFARIMLKKIVVN